MSKPLLDEKDWKPLDSDVVDFIGIAHRTYLAVVELHKIHADDLCWMPQDINKVFEAAGLPPQNLQVGNKESMLKNCGRFIDCLQSGGNWKSYVELEEENRRLKNKLAAFGLHEEETLG
jgi:hypothetical protein